MMFSLFSQGCYVVGGLTFGDSEGCLRGGKRWSEVWLRTVYYAIVEKKGFWRKKRVKKPLLCDKDVMQTDDIINFGLLTQ